MFILSHSNSVYSLCVLPNGTLLTGSADGLKSWNPNTGQLIANLNQITGEPILRIKYLYDNLVATGINNYVITYSLSNNSLIRSMLTGGLIYGMDVVQREYLATTASNDFWWIIWHVPTGVQVSYGWNYAYQPYLITVDAGAPQLKGFISFLSS